MRFRWLFTFIVLALPFSIMALDLRSLWNFKDPELSEQQFRTALAAANGDDALILQTQIARAYGLRRNFAQAQQLLSSIEPQIRNAGAEAQVHYTLESGRTLASATHPPETQTPEAREQARSAYLHAFELAKLHQLDDLAIDALHMLAFVDTAPTKQLKWGTEALAIVESSSQPSAKRWEASLRNNVGYALHQLGRYQDALLQFEKTVVLRGKGTDAQATRVAHWMVGWTIRALDRLDDALDMQLRLEREGDAAGVPDPHVFEELETIYKAKGNLGKAAAYAEKKRALPK